LPLIQPEIFKNFVIPYNKKIISFVRREFKTPPPSVIMGGDTATLVDFMLEANVSLIAADFNANFDLIRGKTAQANTIVRGCVDPKMIERGDWKGLKHTINTLATKSRGMTNFVWGCGCVSYDTTKENLLQFKDLCLQVDNLRKS